MHLDILNEYGTTFEFLIPRPSEFVTLCLRENRNQQDLIFPDFVSISNHPCNFPSKNFLNCGSLAVKRQEKMIMPLLGFEMEISGLLIKRTKLNL